MVPVVDPLVESAMAEVVPVLVIDVVSDVVPVLGPSVVGHNTSTRQLVLRRRCWAVPCAI